ncbi:uncharacterized protein LOC125757414 [Rhipicephalus sanguineus]|uniref:CCHC-type domain-containing protein n=1 Tax=Rhipicephalus sanguineus TaxID=34632 RepID=A0A9D4Q7S1_RHISA|nr:uncharacterized protein LOC125757414 [Rhipicephalus sanguineus]KAH7969364.1 hypothetical protein HPB52_017127 [Rhipicephalus sanguineus]
MGPVLRQRPRPAGAAAQPRAVSDPSTTGDTSAQQAGTPPSATFASLTNTALRQQSHEPATPAQPNKPIHERESSQTSTSSPAATEETDASTASSSSWEHATPPSSPATPVASSEAGSSRSFTASPSLSSLSAAVTAAPVLPAAAVTGPNTPAATSAPQGFEQPTTSSRPFLSQRCDQATPMPCPNTSGHTIIFRPVGKKTHFLALSRDNIASFLSGFPATRRVRVNYRRNLVAVDTHQASDPTSLLQVAVICDVKVRSKILTPNTCVGLVFGVDPRFDAEAISANICSSVPVTSCVRRGKCLTITFEGTTVPKEIFLYKQRRLVRPRLPRPLQCTRCGRYGHATATCSLDERCLRCGASHAAEPCTAEQPRCINCNGNHASTDPRCSSWQLQRKAAVILASSDGSVTRRQALERAGNVVRNKQGTSVVTKGRSFRDALTGGCASTTTEPTPSTTSAPAPQADPKDVVLAALAAAIRAVLPFVPDDSPVRALCAAALAAHDVIAPTG